MEARLRVNPYTEPLMFLSRLSVIAVLPAAVGCATVGMMRALPPDAGQLAHYAASPDTLTAVAAAAVRQQGLAVAEVTQPDPLTRVVIGRKPPGLFSKGEYVRFWIERDTGSLTAVRVVTKSAQLLDLTHRDRAPSLFRAMDAQLDAEAIGPWPGMRVRATPQRGAPIVGSVVRVTKDSIVLLTGYYTAPQPLALGNLSGLAVTRGSYSHSGEGALIGVLVGGIVGAVVASASGDSGDPFAGLGIFIGATAGAAGGGLIGAVLGGSTRTEVWSEVPRRPRR
jgi:hypothetical protein